MIRFLCLVFLGVVLASSSSARAQDKKLTLGVYLPSTVNTRDKQFELGQALATALSAQLGQTVLSRPFARHEDFTKAAADGQLDLAFSEATVLAQAKGEFQAAAICKLDSDGASRWAIVSQSGGAVARLKGKRLAVVKGPGSDADFVSNVVFGGDLPPSHFQLVFVPTVESALLSIGAGKADAALVPAVHAPADLKVLYRSGRVTGAVLARVKGAALGPAAAKVGAIAPCNFVAASGDEVAALRRRIAHAPPVRAPLVAESPFYRPAPATLGPFKNTGLQFPSFVELVEATKDQPDD